MYEFLIHLPYKAEAATTELKGLGDVSYYNAIIFGDHSATSADIEGAMAVQKYECIKLYSRSGCNGSE